MATNPKWQRVQKTKSAVTIQQRRDYASVGIAGYTFAIKCCVSAAEPYVGCSCLCTFTAGSLHLTEQQPRYRMTAKQLNGYLRKQTIGLQMGTLNLNALQRKMAISPPTEMTEDNF